MRRLLNTPIALLLAGLLGGFPVVLSATDGAVNLQLSGSTVLLKVDGDKDDDWWLQSSTNLTAWTTMTNFGTLLSGNETNAPWRSAGTMTSGPMYYRALQTAGLYDPTLFRTISLTFTQTSITAITQALALGRQYNSNVYTPQLTLNNGATNYSIGARFKGNTSYTMGGAKKSVNIELDYAITNADLMGYSTINLNNAAGDETIMREPIYFTVMAKYCPSPKGAMARLYFNGSDRGVYSLAQQENGQLLNEWFPSNNGDRWRAPNAPSGGFTSTNSAFAYLSNSTNINVYLPHYELKTDNATTNVAFARLINAIYVLNTTATNLLRDKVEDVFAVDSWLWFLAIENIFVDDDSYWNKGADYGFYYEIESGRIHPVEHDGNESFTAIGSLNAFMSPLQGYNTGTRRPLLTRLLGNTELRQRYLAHLRTVMTEYFNPAVMTPLINQFHALSVNAIIADPLKSYTMATYTNDLVALKTYVTNRYNYLMVTNTELRLPQPNINSVIGPATVVYATNVPFITANVTANGSSGVGSVWLYYRDKPYGKFAVRQMFDDGAHGDGVAGDNVFGAATTNYPAGNKIHYYVEARGTNTAARFLPAHAEGAPFNYSVALTVATNTSVVINEFMASNTGTIVDPQGEFDDWIELRNLTGDLMDLTGLYLTDEPANPRKWPFPAGTTIAGDGYLLVWADEDGLDTPGLHASFKLSGDGEQIYLIDTDANNNQVLDAITFEAQSTDVSYGRGAANPDVWITMTPTPDSAN